MQCQGIHCTYKWYKSDADVCIPSCCNEQNETDRMTGNRIKERVLINEGACSTLFSATTATTSSICCSAHLWINKYKEPLPWTTQSPSTIYFPLPLATWKKPNLDFGKVPIMAVWIWEGLLYTEYVRRIYDCERFWHNQFQETFFSVVWASY